MEWSRGPVIGRGSTATVSLATSTASGHLLALKSADLSRSLFLQREQSILSNLSSPYIVKYVGSGVSHEDGGTPTYNLCMEYAAGGTLRDEIRRRGGRMGEGEIGAVARRVLKGLEYLHGEGLAHCDIKPQNVLVDEAAGGAVIGDFGCAKFVVEGGSEVVGFSGTPAFMAPEVARGEEQGFAADVWAVGCTVIEMATGRNPWAELGGEDDPVSALYRIGFSGEIPAVPSWLSEEASDFVGKCLVRDPRERWSARGLLDHPFLHESESIDGFKEEAGERSPSCVLDQGFWDSLDDGGLDSSEDLTVDEAFGSRIPPGDRIKSLITSASKFSDWSSEEEGWITVRSNESVEKDGMLVDSESSSVEQDAASPFWDSTILDLDQEDEKEELGWSDADVESPAAGLEFDSVDNVIVTISSSGDVNCVVKTQVDENSNINDNSDSSTPKSLVAPRSFPASYSFFPERTKSKLNSCKNRANPIAQSLAYCSVLVETEGSHYHVTLKHQP
ncbi:unnamed protein product [Linum tenue]|uniref:Protein kinase domain-containing protein n=2 Tax=Linum tenue TaxID=586396 RepID=A0AAV0LRX7_9ROSI|nr:unnamed protein product [Linum tenue]